MTERHVQNPVRVCFVCLGNICRSPTAEAVFRALVTRAGLASHIAVESAGTADYHVGELPDPRSRSAAARRGLTLSSRARQFGVEDWARLDYVIAMDGRNLAHLRAMAPAAEHVTKLRTLRSFDPDAPEGAAVPDPYSGGPEGFEAVLDLCEVACARLLAHIRREHGL